MGEQKESDLTGFKMTLSQDVSSTLFGGGGILMPTPKALDGVKGNLKSSQERVDSGHQVDLPNVAVDLVLLGTPRTSAANASTEKQVEADAPKSRIEDQVLITNWGKSSISSRSTFLFPDSA